MHIMKRFILSIVSTFIVGIAFAQSPLNGTFYNKDLNIRLKLHLDAADIPVPGLELDSCYGYMTGTINSMWVVLKVKKNNGTKAVVRAMCEKGDNAQDLELELKNDQLNIKQIDDAFIKGIKDRKYVKLPKVIVLDKE